VYSRYVSSEHPQGIRTVGCAASPSGSMHFSHSVPRKGIPRTVKRDMRDDRAQTAYGLLNRNRPHEPPPPLWEEGSCQEFDSLPRHFPRDRPGPGDFNNKDKCTRCDMPIVTFTLNRDNGKAMPMCKHCQRLAEAATNAHPGMRIVDLGHPLGARREVLEGRVQYVPMGLSTSLPGGAPFPESARFQSYEHEGAVSGFSCLKRKLTFGRYTEAIQECSISIRRSPRCWHPSDVDNGRPIKDHIQIVYKSVSRSMIPYYTF
jgi:hypothetical protein